MATDFLYQVRGVLGKFQDGAESTKAERRKVLTLIDRQLSEAGYRNLQLRGFKPKHVTALLQRWQAEGLSAATIKNRMAHVRWLSEKIGKAGMLASSNTTLGIERRTYVTNTNRARELAPAKLADVRDPHVAMSLRLQAAFGLRREEAMKLKPQQADNGDRLCLQGSWCKNGKPREVPIRTPEQRALLDEAKQLAGSGSLIPSGLKYVQQMKRYEHECIRIGLDKAHGLRHAYAQQRYQELTGWPAPTAGGPARAELTPAQRDSDRMARLQVSHELGHERESITAVYLGR